MNRILPAGAVCRLAIEFLSNSCLIWRRKNSFSGIRLIVIWVGVSFWIVPTALGQIYSYTNNISGTPNSVATNATGTNLTLGSGLTDGDCNSTGQGFDADGWPTTTANIATSNASGDYIQFSVTPNIGYQLNITSFTADLRRSDPGGSSDDGPTAVRYAYSLDGGTTFIENGANLTPNNNSSCTNTGSTSSWNMADFSAAGTVVFRIYGFSGGSNGTGDLSLRNVTLNGTVTAMSSPFTYNGNGLFTVPAGVSCVRIQAWGGGGGGGFQDTGGGGGTDGGGGGGGGGYREGILAVSSSDNITITVGIGGAGAATTNTNGAAGGSSIVTHSSGTITAGGGSGGFGTTTTGGSGGTGSFSGTIYGQVANNGGSGGAADNNEGGGGGGAGGTISVGGNGTDGSTCDCAPAGGAGGGGGAGDGGSGGNDGAGSDGALIGGGGGGAGDDGGGGGSGADGRVIISWNLSSSTPGTITAGSPASSCSSPFNPPNITGDNPGGTYSWQSSTDGGANWSTIGGATSQSYDPGNITATTQYRRIRSVTGECPGISNVVTYAINTPPTAGAPTTASVCTNSSVNIAGNPTGGSGTYTTHAWTITNAGGTGATDGANLTNANTATVTFNGIGLSAGTVTLQYTVTDDNGCSGSKTVAVTVDPSPTTTGLIICQGGSGSLTSSSTCPSGGSSSSGPNNPSSGINNNTIGTLAWSNPGNIFTDNNSSAIVTVSSGGTVAATTNYLQGTNFSFSIPTNAVIDGIEVTINRFSSLSNGTNNVQDNIVRLIKGGSIIGNNNSISGNWSTNSSTVVSYGGTSDLWGTTWAPSEINASNFGVVLSANINRTGGNTVTASVDHIQITVTYTIPGVLNWYTVSSGGTSIGSGSPFNPVGVAGSGLPNTNTPGTYTFWAECSLYPGCRTQTDFVINPSVTPSISIAANPGDNICAGTSVTFTATPTNGGASPTYQWKLNGGNVGSNSDTYVNASLANGDQVTCEMTSNAACASPATVTSNTVTMTVNANVTPSVSISANPAGAICAGTNVTFTATASNTGGGTVTYDFKVNGGSVQSGASDTYASTTLANNDQVTCDISISGGTCLTASTATSNTITMTVNALPTANAGSALAAFCQGGTSSALGGSVGGSATGGTWDDGGVGGTFTPDATDLNATWTPPANYSGTATLTLTSSGGPCGTAMDSKTQVVYPRPTAGTCNQVDDACYSNMGSIDVQASGGTPPYTVTWSPMHGSLSPALTMDGDTGTISGLQAGQQYVITVSDSNGCQAISN